MSFVATRACAGRELMSSERPLCAYRFPSIIPDSFSTPVGQGVLAKLWCTVHPACASGGVVRDVVGRSDVTAHFVGPYVGRWARQTIRDVISRCG
jgi:hypothetical protein